MKMTGGDALAQQLVHEGSTDVFGVPGVQLDWAVEGLRKVSDTLAYTVTRHEQAASYAADGYARSSGKPGICMVVPGPGLLNAMAGLATAFACNSRVLCIVGDIHSAAIGKGLGLLHEVRDQSRILGSVTKWQGRAMRPDDVPGIVRQAFHQLMTGRPQPVGIEIPHDVLSASADISLLDPVAVKEVQPDIGAIERAAFLIERSKNPVIYAGGGVLSSGASRSLRALAEKLQCPVVMGENGRGALSDRHPLALSTLEGRAVFPDADLVLVVGSRFVDTALGRPAWPTDNKTYIYINLDPSAWSSPRRADCAIECDCRTALEALERACRTRPATVLDIQRVRASALEQINDIEPQASWVRALRSAIPDDGVLVNELTQVGYFARLAYPVYEPNTLLSPGYQGTLGYGLPTALGAAVANRNRVVVSINGDGGFGWNMQELATARKYSLNVSIVVFNDGHFGNVRKMQNDQFQAEYGIADKPSVRSPGRCVRYPVFSCRLTARNAGCHRSALRRRPHLRRGSGRLDAKSVASAQAHAAALRGHSSGPDRNLIAVALSSSSRRRRR
ncbi:MAG: thiamine pyrophosphate-binding protein [Pseudorhodoplanes sp.]